MYKKLLILFLTISSFAYYQSSLAHNEGGNNVVDSGVKRQAAEDQRDRDSWNSFMESVKSQEKKQVDDKKLDAHEEHHKDSE